MELPDLLFEHGHIVEKSEFDSVWGKILRRGTVLNLC
jgi:hypothetical protein